MLKLLAALFIMLEFSNIIISDNPTKLFSDLYLPKFLDTSAKSFCTEKQNSSFFLFSETRDTFNRYLIEICQLSV